MPDQIWQRDEVDSPCVKICVMHPDAKLCVGCFRSLEEITEWSSMTAERRQEVMAELADRKGLLTKRRGGRKSRLERK